MSTLDTENKRDKRKGLPKKFLAQKKNVLACLLTKKSSMSFSPLMDFFGFCFYPWFPEPLEDLSHSIVRTVFETPLMLFIVAKNVLLSPSNLSPPDSAASRNMSRCKASQPQGIHRAPGGLPGSNKASPCQCL